MPGEPLQFPSDTMLTAEEAFKFVERAEERVDSGLGFQRVTAMKGESYKDTSTIVLVPTRGTVNVRVVQTWQSLIAPMNQRRAWFYCTGDEVGRAYNRMIEKILVEPAFKDWKYILTLEDDNLQPPDAHVRLLETIEEYRFDAVSGIYFTKGPRNEPMAYGDPDLYQRTGKLEFSPRDVRAAMKQGHVMPVNGIAMGCALWRIDLFRQIPPPWFVTVADVVDGGIKGFTQDLYFCERAVRAGKRFGVDFRVRVGHLDVSSGVLY